MVQTINLPSITFVPVSRAWNPFALKSPSLPEKSRGHGVLPTGENPGKFGRIEQEGLSYAFWNIQVQA